MTPSKVSTKASCSKNVRERRLIRVDDSLRVRRIVVKAAKGPLTNTSTASCGRYATKNMATTTTTESESVGASLERRGFHNDRWLKK